MKFIKLVLALLLISFNSKAQNVKDFTLNSVTDKSSFTLSKSKGNCMLSKKVDDLVVEGFVV